MPSLAQMEIFYYVATWNSFSRAAIELGVSKGYVSSQISKLEQDLGVKLLHRTTRHLSLTEEGSLFFAGCSKIISEKKLITSTIKESQIEPSGHLKITAPPSMCATFLAELLPKFLQQYPKITLAIDSSAIVKNLVQHGIDIALRVTHTPDENYIARLITPFHFVICATPKYLQKYGTPKTADDLIRHNCLVYSADPTRNQWPFQIKEVIKIVTVQGNLISDTSMIIQKALLQHQGIARLPEYIITNEIAAQKLIPLFTENVKMTTPIYAIYASNVTIPTKIKCFIQFLKENITSH